MATHIDRETFLRNLHQSGLLNEREIMEALPQLPSTRRGRVIARALVRLGLLTRFQAGLLLAGRTSGFHLGQYRILDQLGQGGMGRVFKAIHQTMNRVVALKILAPNLVKTARAMELFQQEVRAAARLIHPNIVHAYDANQIGDRHFLVMEYVDGPNLDQLVRQNGPLPVGLACEIVRQIANGLQYAQEMGMVHRDIKPANLLVQLTGKNKELVVKILDFGLARLGQEAGDRRQEAGDKNRVVMGTPDFLSPEQARGGQEVDIRSDLYSLGGTFYYLLTGRVPFPGGNSLEKLERQQYEEPPPVEEIRAEVPAPVAGIVRRLMAKYPPHRFQTPQELAEALLPFADRGHSSLKKTSASAAAEEEASLPSTGDLSQERPDLAATAGTLPPDFSATPLSNLGLGLPQRLPWEEPDPREERRRFRRALLGALAIVAVLVGGIVLVVWQLLE